MPHRIDYSLSNDEYHAAPDLNTSAIKELLKSPSHYQEYVTAPRKPPTHAKLIGSAVHAAVLEPDIFYSNYVVLPENFDGRTKENKEKVDSLKTSGRTPLKFEDYQHCLDMATALHTHATARRLLNQGCAEVSVFAEIDGIPVKCRPDWLRKESRLIVDLKTTEDASERGFTR